MNSTQDARVGQEPDQYDYEFMGAGGQHNTPPVRDEVFPRDTGSPMPLTFADSIADERDAEERRLDGLYGDRMTAITVEYTSRSVWHRGKRWTADTNWRVHLTDNAISKEGNGATAGDAAVAAFAEQVEVSRSMASLKAQIAAASPRLLADVKPAPAPLIPRPSFATSAERVVA